MILLDSSSWSLPPVIPSSPEHFSPLTGFPTPIYAFFKQKYCVAYRTFFKNATIQNFIYVAVLQLVRKQNVEFLSQLQQNTSSSNT